MALIGAGIGKKGREVRKGKIFRGLCKKWPQNVTYILRKGNRGYAREQIFLHIAAKCVSL